MIPSSKILVESSHFRPDPWQRQPIRGVGGTLGKVRRPCSPGSGVRERCWHLVDRGQGCSWTCDYAQARPPPPRITLPNVSIVLRFRWLKDSVKCEDTEPCKTAPLVSGSSWPRTWIFLCWLRSLVCSWLRKAKNTNALRRLAPCHCGWGETELPWACAHLRLKIPWNREVESQQQSHCFHIQRLFQGRSLSLGTEASLPWL